MRIQVTVAAAVGACLLACASAADRNLKEAYPLPEVPQGYVTPGDRADYISVHFWDRAVYPECDTVTPGLEQAFADYVSIIGVAGASDSIATGVERLVEAGGRERILELAEKYLYEADSPMRSERLFRYFLEATPDMPRSAGLLEIVMKNREGSRAADFKYTTPAGEEGTLSGFASASDTPVVVYFFDSECDVCKGLIEPVAGMAAGRYRVLAVCPEGNAEKFDDVLPLFPADWTVVRDCGEIDGEDLYDFPAMPTVYVLSPDMTVLGKDVRVRQ